MDRYTILAGKMSYTNRETNHESLITEKSLHVCTSEYRLGTNVSHAKKILLTRNFIQHYLEGRKKVR